MIIEVLVGQGLERCGWGTIRVDIGQHALRTCAERGQIVREVE